MRIVTGACLHQSTFGLTVMSPDFAITAANRLNAKKPQFELRSSHIILTLTIR